MAETVAAAGAGSAPSSRSGALALLFGAAAGALGRGASAVCHRGGARWATLPPAMAAAAPVAAVHFYAYTILANAVAPASLAGHVAVGAAAGALALGTHHHVTTAFAELRRTPGQSFQDLYFPRDPATKQPRHPIVAVARLSRGYASAAPAMEVYRGLLFGGYEATKRPPNHWVANGTIAAVVAAAASLARVPLDVFRLVRLGHHEQRRLAEASTAVAPLPTLHAAARETLQRLQLRHFVQAHVGRDVVAGAVAVQAFDFAMARWGTRRHPPPATPAE